MNERMALMDLPWGVTLRSSCSSFERFTAGDTTLFRLTLAGAFQTPRVLSTIV